MYYWPQLSQSASSSLSIMELRYLISKKLWQVSQLLYRVFQNNCQKEKAETSKLAPATALQALATPSPLRNQISAKKWLVGESLTFFFSKDYKTTLTFCQVTPVLGSQCLPFSSRPPFWPAEFIFPRSHWKLIYFFHYWPSGGGVWHDSRCSWLASSPPPGRYSRQRPRLTATWLAKQWWWGAPGIVPGPAGQLPAQASGAA